MGGLANYRCQTCPKHKASTRNAISSVLKRSYAATVTDKVQLGRSLSMITFHRAITLLQPVGKFVDYTVDHVVTSYVKLQACNIK